MTDWCAWGRGKDKPLTLAFTVIPAMPRLQAELLGLPAAMLAGELARCRLRLTNAGNQPLTGLRLVVSHPDVYCGPSACGLDGDVISALSGTREGADRCTVSWCRNRQTTAVCPPVSPTREPDMPPW